MATTTQVWEAQYLQDQQRFAVAVKQTFSQLQQDTMSDASIRELSVEARVLVS